jgi:hypothetical protein
MIKSEIINTFNDVFSEHCVNTDFLSIVEGRGVRISVKSGNAEMFISFMSKRNRLIAGYKIPQGKGFLVDIINRGWTNIESFMEDMYSNGAKKDDLDRFCNIVKRLNAKVSSGYS